MTKNFASKIALAALVLSSACVMDDEDADEDVEVSAKIGLNGVSMNALTANKIGLNGISTNKIGLNGVATTNMMATQGSRDVYAYAVNCALPAGQTVTAKDAKGVSYTFTGALNLAPAWGTRALTTSERRWVSACLLSRTNLFGIQVQISLRNDSNTALATSTAERTQFSNTEGAFFGDLFAETPVWFACSNRAWTPYTTNSLRMCALSSNGTSTDCGFKYVGTCASACTDTVAPFSQCIGTGTRYAEVITVNLTPTQQQGQPQ